jgi:hypothetical protein
MDTLVAGWSGQAAAWRGFLGLYGQVGGQQGERGGLGPGDLDEGGRAVGDVAGLAGGQAADQVGVGGPGVLEPGGALVAPGGADELVRCFQHAAGAGQFAQRLG